jgi:hypothetical protein
MSSSWIDLARGCEFVSAVLADELHLAGQRVREIAFSEPYTVQALSTHTLNATLTTGAVLGIEFTTRELIAAGDEGAGKAEAVARIRDFVAGLSRH